MQVRLRLIDLSMGNFLDPPAGSMVSSFYGE
jgi:hypothetical protein